MFTPAPKNPLHSALIYQEGSGRLPSHRKSNLKKSPLNGTSSLTVHKQNDFRVRWNSPISFIRIIPARGDSDMQGNKGVAIFAPNFSDPIAQQILENATPKPQIPNVKRQKTYEPAKPNNRSPVVSKQYDFGNANDSITRITPATTPSEDIHYLDLGKLPSFLEGSLPRSLANNDPKAQSQLQSAPHVVIEKATDLIARMNLRFLAQSAGHSSLYTSKPQSPALQHTTLVLEGTAEQHIPATTNRLSIDKPLIPRTPESVKLVPLGSWSSENRPPQLYSDYLKQKNASKRKAETGENERPSKIIKANHNLPGDSSKEASPTAQHVTSYVSGDETGHPDSDEDHPASSDSEESDDDDSLFGDNEVENSLLKPSLALVQECTAPCTNQEDAKTDLQPDSSPLQPPLMKVDELKVARWKERLDKYAVLRTVQVERWNAKLADALYELLHGINAVKEDPYLEPHVLAKTQLAKTMKKFRHSEYGMATRAVADEITKFWRQMCREAATRDEGNPGERSST